MGETFRCYYFDKTVTNTSRIERSEKTLQEIASWIDSYNTKKKHTGYLIRGDADYRNDENMKTVEWIFIDGDGSLEDLDSAPDPFDVHNVMIEHKINHVIYQSFSDTPERNRWRLAVPARGLDLGNWKLAVNHILGVLQANGVPIKPVTENVVLSQPWFITGAPDKENRWPAIWYERGEVYELPSDYHPIDLKYPVIEDDGVVRIHTGNELPKIDESQAEINLKYGEALHPSAVSLIARGWAPTEIRDLISANEVSIVARRGQKRFDRIMNGELDEVFAWVMGKEFEGADKVDPLDFTKPIAKSPVDYFADMIPTEEYLQEIENLKIIYPGLLVAGNIMTIVAMSGYGKTTFMFWEVAPHLARTGRQVIYIDTDSPSQDHREMKQIADRYGFAWVNPNTARGKSEKTVIAQVDAMIKDGVSLKNFVFIFDTLKKFADLMSKESVKSMYKRARKLAGLGASIAFLGHANKERDKRTGHQIFEGVGDIRSDTDDLIFLEMFEAPDFPGLRIVSTVYDMLEANAKLRGHREPFSFSIDADRNVQMVGYIPPPDRKKKKGRPRIDDEMVKEWIMKFLKDGRPRLQADIISFLQDRISVGRDTAAQILRTYSEKEGGPKEAEFDILWRRGERNAKVFFIKTEPTQKDLF